MNTICVALVLSVFAPPVSAELLPAWLFPKTVKVGVIDDAGRIQGRQREIKRGDRVKVRDFQGRGPKILEKLNRDVTEDTGDVNGEERWAARDEAHDFEWIVGQDVSLRKLRKMLDPKLVTLPKEDLSGRIHFRVPSAILLEVNGEKVQDYPPRHCPLAFEQ